MTLLTLLQTNLPGEWEQTDPFRHVHLLNTIDWRLAMELVEIGVFIRIGSDRVTVVAKGNAMTVYGYNEHIYTTTTSKLFRAVPDVVARMAVVCIGRGDTVDVPEWAADAVNTEKNRRMEQLVNETVLASQRLANIQEERERLRAYKVSVTA